MHILIVEIDEAFLDKLAADGETITDEDREAAASTRVECQTAGGCGGWEQCLEDHPGHNEEDGYDPDSTTFAADVELHGTLHRWRPGYGWTVAHRGCWLEDGADWDADGRIPMTRSGRYLVDAECDDGLWFLTLVEEVLP